MNTERNISENLSYVNIDEGLLWLRIEKELNKKKKRRILFLFILGVFLIASVVLITNFNKESKIKIVSNTVINSATDESKVFEEKLHTDDSDETSSEHFFSRHKLQNNSTIKTHDNNSIVIESPDIIKTSISKFVGKTYENYNNEQPEVIKTYEQEQHDIFKSDITYENHIENISILESKLLISDINDGSLIDLLANGKLSKIKKIKKLKSQLFFGIGFGSLKSNNVFDKNNEWHSLINKNEKPVLATQIQLQYNKSIIKNLYVSVGIKYNRIVSKFNGVSSITNSREIDSDSSRFIIIDGQNFYFDGKKIQTITNTDYYSVYNRFSCFELPFGIGYNFSLLKSRFTISTNSSLRVLSSLSGYTYDNKLNIRNYIELNENIKLNYGLSNINFKLNYSYPVLNNAVVFVEVQKQFPLIYNYSINFSNSSDFKSRYDALYVNIGMGYNFRN